MLIRSQDETVLIPFNSALQIVIRYEDDKNNRYTTREIALVNETTVNTAAYILIAGVTVGIYNSEKAAIRVIDDIQEEYLRYVYTNGGPSFSGNYGISEFAFNPPKVFQMPAREEVRQ